MKIIIPMAGMGKRMRPHTLTIPKPLIRIAGKPIVQRLAEDISLIAGQELEEIAFIVGDFGKDVEANLLKIASDLGAKGKIYYQHEALGTAHAILCAEPSLNGKVVIAFADTLFKAGFHLDEDKDGVIWVHKVEDPRSFGVVKTDQKKNIIAFVEKPQNFVSDLAIIGIYYFKEASLLRDELQNLINKKLRKNDEYQLTDALENMVSKGFCFSIDEVDEWLDCGNKDATVYANKRILEFSNENDLIHPTAVVVNSIINKPCYLGANVHVENSIIGPFVSVGENTQIESSVVSNSIIQTHSRIKNVNLNNSMIGNFVEYIGRHNEDSIGDYTSLS
jgi:glucose-1-phosphate thymidylyltransferase